MWRSEGVEERGYKGCGGVRVTWFSCVLFISHVKS